MSSPSNKKSTDDLMHSAAMRALHNWMDIFNKLPHFGGSDVFKDVYEWMEAQNPQYWSSQNKVTPQIGDIFCAYLIVVGICERFDITTALAILKDPEVTIRDNGQTKDFWNQKLQKHLHIHSVEFQYEEGSQEAIGLKIEHHTDRVKKAWHNISDSEKIKFLCESAGFDIEQIDIQDFDLSLLEHLGEYSMGYPQADFGVAISPKKKKSTSENLQ